MSENTTNVSTTKANAENAVEPTKTIDLSAIMAAQQAKKEEQTKVTEPAPVEEKAESPLAQLLKKQQEEGTGMVVNDNEFQDKEPEKQFKNPVDSEIRKENAERTLKEYDDKLTKRSALVLINRPQNPADYAELESEMDALEFDDEGHPYFNYYKEDATGEKIPLKPRFFIIRTPEYGPYDKKTEELYSQGKTPAEVLGNTSVKQSTESNTIQEASTTTPAQDTNSTSDEKKQIVQILIDKTGYGSQRIDFTDEEKKTIYESEEILLTSVRKLDLKSIRINTRTDKDSEKKIRSFQETARNHQLSDSHADVTFVNSGFHAQMTGMNYGELSDAAIDPDMIDFDRMNKQATVIYNHMTNMSRPPFESYDDFLKNFAYADLDMALYGLYVATMPSLQTLGLTCGRQDCQNRFNQNFHTRELLQFDRCTETYLNRFRTIINSKPQEWNAVLNDAPLFNTTLIELPESKYCVEFGPITLYDYLYKVLPIGNEETFRATFGDNPSMHILENMESIPAIRQIMVPDGEGGYDPYDSLKDLMDILASVSTDEIKIIRSMTRYILADSICYFGLKNIKCPKCGTPTEYVPVDIGTLVFQEHERLQNTTIDVTKWHLI